MKSGAPRSVGSVSQVTFSGSPRWRVYRAAVLGALVGVHAVVVAPLAVSAAVVPVVGFPTLELQRTILTSPFVGAPTKRPGDVEGLAFDPVRNTLWLADDSKFQLYEVDYSTGALVQTITPAMLAATLKYQLSSPPSAPAAGISRSGDLEALAYDAAHDQLFAFSGHCCPPAKPHDPTVFRLTRGVSGHFELESYQPLPAEAPFNDFSGVGAIEGQLWGGLDQTLYRYDYVTNTFPEHVGPLPIGGGKLNGVGFSADGKDLWVTASNDRLYRLAWPGLDLIPDHDFPMAGLGLLDTRAVEIVGNEIVMADGYDFYPPGTVDEFALRIYTIGTSAPTASFTTTPKPAVGGAPLAVTFSDTSIDRPATWLWAFGDGATSTVQHPIHIFAAVGTYGVKLTVTNPNGTSSATSTVTVTKAPTAGFTMSATSGPAPLTVAFTDTSVGGISPIETRAWNFGDGTSSSDQNPAHVFTTPGTFRVALTVANANGTSTIDRSVTVTPLDVLPPPRLATPSAVCRCQPRSTA